MPLVCTQPTSLGNMSRGRRWAVFVVAMVETMLWSGTIFGWASLVHALKLQGVYYDLCPVDQREHLEHDPAPDAHNATTVPTSPGHGKVSESPVGRSAESSRGRCSSLGVLPGKVGRDKEHQRECISVNERDCLVQ